MAQVPAGPPASQGGSTVVRVATAAVALAIGAVSVAGTIRRILADR